MVTVDGQASGKRPTDTTPLVGTKKAGTFLRSLSKQCRHFNNERLWTGFVILRDYSLISVVQGEGGRDGVKGSGREYRKEYLSDL